MRTLILDAAIEHIQLMKQRKMNSTQKIKMSHYDKPTTKSLPNLYVMDEDEMFLLMVRNMNKARTRTEVHE